MSHTDPSTWAPDLTSEQLWGERSYFAGILIGAVAYGVHCTLFFTALTLLWARQRSHWKDYIWIAYVVVLFTISSVGNGMQFKYTQMGYIDNRNYPGGPGVYIQVETTTAGLTSNISYIINGWFQDVLILYRFWVIYGRSYVALAGPAIAFIAEIVVSIVLFAGLAGGSVLRSDTVSKLLTSYFAISVALNIILTLAIVSKLIAARRSIGSVDNHSESSQYVSVAAMLIESAALYSACGIIFLVPWGLHNLLQQLVLPTLAQVESIAPMLIIMRVAQGRAWAADTQSRLQQTSTIRFSPPEDSTVALSASAFRSKGASTLHFQSASSDWNKEDEEANIEKV